MKLKIFFCLFGAMTASLSHPMEPDLETLHGAAAADNTQKAFSLIKRNPACVNKPDADGHYPLRYNGF